MYQNLKNPKDLFKYAILFSSIIIIFLLVAVAYKNDNEISNIGKNSFNQDIEVKKIKEFLLKKIKSPFVNVNYEVKSGDTIQKILKKFDVENKEIYEVIKQYKKYAPASSLFQGSEVEILVKENFPKKNNTQKKDFR